MKEKNAFENVHCVCALRLYIDDTTVLPRLMSCPACCGTAVPAWHAGVAAGLGYVQGLGLPCSVFCEFASIFY